MSSPVVTNFFFDADNEDKIGRHGLTPSQVMQVLDSHHVIAPNRKGRRGLYLIIGRDHGGAAITIPVEATHEPTTWRPITAWVSKEHEQRKL